MIDGIILLFIIFFLVNFMLEGRHRRRLSAEINKPKTKVKGQGTVKLPTTGPVRAVAPKKTNGNGHGKDDPSLIIDRPLTMRELDALEDYFK